MTRDRKIDILRTLALICIIFAHVDSPDIVYNLRNFDVPLMALLMGASFYLSRKDKSVRYLTYLQQRLRRLVLPAWSFLTIFFVLFRLIAWIRADSSYYNLDQIIKSYALVGGIGYVWIIAVFVSIAIFNPIILAASQKVPSQKVYLLALMGIYLPYLGLVRLGQALSTTWHLLFQQFVLFPISYGLVAAIGIRLFTLKKQEIAALATAFLAIFLIIGSCNGFLAISKAKYPPTSYYLAYSLFVSLALFLLLDIKPIAHLLDNRLTQFCSKNSLWLYLWHIIPITVLERFGSAWPILSESFLARFALAFLFALGVTAIQRRLVGRLADIPR